MIDSVPFEILRDRGVSVLESIVEFLKEQKELSFHEIGILLNRDERNMWTVYNRAIKKRQNKLVNKSSNQNKKDVKINISDDKSVSIYGVTIDD